jgi:murein DD-endopeptidase MepM/ murein hydrolase activator NlpD
VTANAQRTFLAGVIAALLCSSGCATSGRTPPVESGPAAAGRPGGVYHTVTRGETLWRIALRYGADVDNIAAANRIQDATRIEAGQRILIPGALKRSMSFAAVPGEDFLWPLRGSVICGFGQAGQGGINKGLNIRPGRESVVKASRSGTVVFYNDDFLGLGKTVIIDHGDGFFTVYAGSRAVSVRPGDIVQRGSPIAEADRECIHFEIRKGAVSQNPAFYLSH